MPVKWQNPDQVAGLSPTLSDWLLNTGSLTERLQALTHSFTLCLLGQQVLDMDKSEGRLLLRENKSEHESWQIREVLLQGKPLNVDAKKANNTPLQDWVFARSVLPNALCHSKWANLGEKQFGSRIFNDNNFVRSDFEIGRLHYHPLTHEAFTNGQQCWARRSKFTIEHYELLVAEAFLPQSPCYW
jgi:chorismate--pyruvate lyase